MYHGERFNSYSHLLGLGVVAGAAAVLLVHALRSGDVAAIAGVAAFGVSSLALYAASLLFHSSRGAQKAWWQRADHAAIFLVIAGTYTGFAMSQPLGVADHTFLVLVWLAAVAGVVREMSGTRRPALWLYVGMGWLCVLGALSFAPLMGPVSSGWLLAGAGFYTVGTVFYRNRRGWAHAHGTWHLFVLAGTASHYVALAFCLKRLPLA
jgi:hemolysin III